MSRYFTQSRPNGPSDRKEVKMRKRELEKLLFQAVADALGVEVNTPREAKSAQKRDVENHEHREAA
jgi:hypothetical protein